MLLGTPPKKPIPKEVGFFRFGGPLGVEPITNELNEQLHFPTHAPQELVRKL